MSTPDEIAAQRIYGPNVLFNSSILSVKFLSACFAGAFAGILGLTNWTGFGLFLFSTVFTTFVISFVNCGGKPEKFIPGGWWGLFNPGQDNVSTFILVWTLFYGIVHVYD